MSSHKPSKLSDFKVIEKLGKGSFGSVYKVNRKSDGRTYALKKVSIRSMPAKERAFAVNEIRLLASLNNPHVIGYCEAFTEQDNLFIVTDMAKKGDLRQKIKRYIRANKKFPEEDIWKYLVQIVTGLDYLHSRNVLHRDLKPGNIFCYTSSHLQIGDLGCSMLLKEKHKLPRNQVGTPYYMAPEVWQGIRYNEKTDIWSLGVIMYELAAHKTPYSAQDIKSLATKVKYNPVPDIPSGYSSDLRRLVRAMLTKNPEERPDAKSIIAMPIVQHHMRHVPALSESQATRCFSTAGGDRKNVSPQMLKTIKVPDNFREVKLPPPRYPTANSANGKENAGKQQQEQQKQQQQQGQVVRSSQSAAGGLHAQPQGAQQAQDRPQSSASQANIANAQASAAAPASAGAAKAATAAGGNGVRRASAGSAAAAQAPGKENNIREANKANANANANAKPNGKDDGVRGAKQCTAGNSKPPKSAGVARLGGAQAGHKRGSSGSTAWARDPGSRNVITGHMAGVGNRNGYGGNYGQVANNLWAPNPKSAHSRPSKPSSGRKREGQGASHPNQVAQYGRGRRVYSR